MITSSLTILGVEKTIKRFPQKHDKSLQAWDSADEYMLETLIPQIQADDKILIVNDAFGALTVFLSQYKTSWSGDSFVAKKATELNLIENENEPLPINFYFSDQCPDEHYDWVLLKIPKTLSLLEHQLHHIACCIGPDTKVIGAGKAKDIHNSTLKLFENIIGPTSTSLAKKKSRLIYATPEKNDASPSQPVTWTLEGTDISLTHLANVFSRDSLDIGARFFLEHLPAQMNEMNVVDLGCGNGVIGLSVLDRFPAAKVLFTDESSLAVASAKLNVTTNFPDQIDQCQFSLNNCLDGVEPNSADVVLCNPPFHQQHTISDHIAKQMFRDAKRVLKKGGELRIVGNRHLSYPHLLKRLFGGYQVVAANKKFSILSCYK